MAIMHLLELLQQNNLYFLKFLLFYDLQLLVIITCQDYCRNLPQIYV